MGAISLEMPFGKNEGLIMSPSELKELYFFGVSVTTQDGREMPDETIATYIRSAQREIETYLNIKLQKQIIEENKDFVREDFKNWNFIRCTYYVNKPFLVQGNLNGVKQIEYPVEWLSSKETNQEDQYFRQIYLVPNAGTADITAVYSGITPHVGFLGTKFIPNYWKVRYCTGFSKTPEDLLNFAGKLAAINVFHIMGDLILGAGIASQSIGIDGLSQSISTTSSATNAGYGSRITGYLADLKIAWPRLKSYYSGLEMMSM